MPRYHAAVLVAGTTLLAGCGTAQEESARAREAKRSDLANMVQKRQLGPLARGLKLDSESSGPSNNKKGAEDTVDPKDSARSLARAGRVHGYDLTYSGGSSPLGVVFVSEGVEMFHSEKAASRYLEKQFKDFRRFRGRKVEGVKLAGLEEFDVGTGEEAAGAIIRVYYPPRRMKLFWTVAAFRRGRVVGNASAALRRDLVVSGDVERIADALDRRIQRLLSGKARRGKAPSIPKTTKGPDPKPLTLDGNEVLRAPRTAVAHQSYLTVPNARVYLREYDVYDGRLAGSKVLYLRTMAQVFGSSGAAAQNQTYIASRKGSNSVARRFLRAFFKRTHFKPRQITAQPLWNDGDTAGFHFFFRVPKGVLEGVELSVRRGRAAGNVLVIGFDRNVEPDDVLAVRQKLRARLRAAESSR